MTVVTRTRHLPRAHVTVAVTHSAIEAIVAAPLLAVLVIEFASRPWLSLAPVASLLAAIGLAGKLRRRYLRSLELERLLARHDPATGAPNRRAFLEALSAEHSRIQRNPEATAGLLFIDFDRFKRVNDLYGHAVGDEALWSVVERLSASLRAHDVAARWGGEEFVLLAPDCDADELGQLAERTRLLFAARPLALSAGDIPVTVSIGATLLTAQSSPGDALEQAGRALKRAKRTRDTSLLDLSS
jgi:diguanylate cyclase (GGDEF)-like protein